VQQGLLQEFELALAHTHVNLAFSFSSPWLKQNYMPELI